MSHRFAVKSIAKKTTRPPFTAASRELAFRLLHIRRLGAGVRRPFTSGREVGGLVEEACGDIRIRRSLRKLKKGRGLFRQIFFARHYLVPRYYPSPGETTRQLEIRSLKKSTKVNFSAVRTMT